MRRGLASLIIGLSLIVASFSWAGFTLSRTLLDPGRSERLADQLLDNPDVRQALTLRLADALEAQIPAEVPVPRNVVEAGAATALDDPRVETLIRDGFVQVHQNALAGNAEPVVIDANGLGAAGRDMLVATRPELDPFLPATPAIEVELPTAGLAWIGSVKNVVDRFTGIGALVAVVGAVTAFVVARRRAPVLRRVAFWGYGASAFWLLVGFGVPWLAGNLSPTSAAIATAAADVFFGAMIRPAVIMAIGATVLLLAGFILPSFERRRGARAAQPRGALAVPVGPPQTAPPFGATPAAAAAVTRTAAPNIAPAPNTAPAPNIATAPNTAPAPNTAGPVVDQTLIQPIQRPGPGPATTAPTQQPSKLWPGPGAADDTDQMPTPNWADQQ